MGQVVVTNLDGVWIAKGCDGDPRRGPGTDAGKRFEALSRAGQVHRHGLFEPSRAVCSADDDLGSAALDAKTVKGPVRRAREHRCRWWNHEAGRSWCGLAERLHKSTIGSVRLDAGHLLREDRRHQSLENGPGLGKAETRIAPMDLGEEGMRGPEAGVVILLPTQRVRSRRGPGRARTPRLDIDRALADLEVDAGRTIRI